ncbi:MAG: NADPH-dependent F420 reductase [Bacteroidota bacterium]
MKIGIIGTGNVAKYLGKALTHKGYNIMIGSSDTSRAKELAGEMEHYASGGTVAHTIHYGEILVLAIPYKEAEAVLRQSDNYKGKILVDCTNPLTSESSTSLALGHTTSAAEEIAKLLPDVRVVKAFNAGFAEHIGSPYFGPNDASMFYCGDDAAAKEAVSRLIEACGFEAVDAGDLKTARLLEPLAALMIKLAFDEGMGREIGIKLLQR